MVQLFMKSKVLEHPFGVVQDITHFIKRKVVNFFYDVKTIIKLMGTNLKENLIICKS